MGKQAIGLLGNRTRWFTIVQRQWYPLRNILYNQKSHHQYYHLCVWDLWPQTTVCSFQFLSAEATLFRIFSGFDTEKNDADMLWWKKMPFCYDQWKPSRIVMWIRLTMGASNSPLKIMTPETSSQYWLRVSFHVSSHRWGLTVASQAFMG